MNILRGSAQPKKSESLNQVFSQSLTENFFFNRCFTSLLVVWCLHSLQSKNTKGWDIQIQLVSHSLIAGLNHFLKEFAGLFCACWLIDWLVLQFSFIRQLFVRCAITDRCEWTCKQQFSPSLCFEWNTDGKCPFRFAVKRTNVPSWMNMQTTVQSVFVFWVNHWWEMSVSFCCEEDKCPINSVWLRTFVL